MTPRIDTSREEQAIQKQVDTFVAAWNRHDPRAMSHVYAEDADLINPSGRVARSRNEIEALFRDEQAGHFKDSHFSMSPQRAQFLTADIAVVTYTFEAAGTIDPSGNRTTMRGHVTNVYRKQGDTWQVVACRPMIPVPGPR
jgi:uncharacterized protein (TIGR02246 family)